MLKGLHKQALQSLNEVPWIPPDLELPDPNASCVARALTGAHQGRGSPCDPCAARGDTHRTCRPRAP